MATCLDVVGRAMDLAFKKAKEDEWFVSLGANPLKSAFSKKKGLHAGMASSAPVEASLIKKTYSELKSLKRTGTAAAYVHIPFCVTHCLYCGFFGGMYTEKSGSEYLKALLWEINNEAELYGDDRTPIQALYLGGGTPTALKAEELLLLLTTLKKSLPLSNDCEITVEGRIYEFDQAKMEACIEGGANRFSIGVQSFNSNLRQALGRVETKETVIKQLKKLHSYNQAAIVIDLIYGLPGQTLSNWSDDIKMFLDLQLDGVDLYQLNIFPDSRLEKSINNQKIAAPVPLEKQGEYYQLGCELMQEARASRLSVSHWRTTSRERNIYNPLAKNRADCLQFGTRAGGTLQGYLIANDFKPASYVERCSNGEKPINMIMPPPANFAFIKVLLEQMEVGRLNLSKLNNALKETSLGDFFDSTEFLYEPLLNNWLEAGLITRDGEWIELTLAGQYWHGNLLLALLGWVNTINQELLG